MENVYFLQALMDLYFPSKLGEKYLWTILWKWPKTAKDKSLSSTEIPVFDIFWVSR